MTYSHILTSNYVSVMNLETGNVVKFTKNEPNYEKAVNLIREGKFEQVEALDAKTSVLNFTAAMPESSGLSLWIDRGSVKYSYGGETKELHNAMTERILKMVEDGFDPEPFVNFMLNLMGNPSKTAVDELYLFLEATGLPITSDGYFIAYKMVNDDYSSIYDSKFKNDVGTVVEMPRNEVNDDRNQTCSNGLHFCSKEYLPHYGTGPGTRLLLVKINPADVVSIPSDYNNAKGRASKYLIWKDITEPGWREKYGLNDYNTKSVETGDWGNDEYEDEDEWEDEFDEVNEHVRAALPHGRCGAFIRGYVHGYNDHLDGRKSAQEPIFVTYRERVNYEEGYYVGQEDADDGTLPRYY